MNVFEMFGFFILGSVFNMLTVLVFLLILIGKIRNSLNDNVKNISVQASALIEKADNIINVFKKGGKNG